MVVRSTTVPVVESTTSTTSTTSNSRCSTYICSGTSMIGSYSAWPVDWGTLRPILKSPPQSSIWPILENYGCRWIETVIKILYEAGGPPHVIELLITVSSKFFKCAIGPSNSLLFSTQSSLWAPISAVSGLLLHHHAVAIAPPAHPRPRGTHRRKSGADGGGCTRLTRQTRPPKVKNHVFFVICRSQECRNRPKRLVYTVAEDISAAPPCVYIP